MTDDFPSRPPQPTPASGTLAPRRRSCGGCAVKGGLGCLAFFGGALICTWLILPGFVEGWVKRQVAAQFSETRQGRLEVGEAELFPLSWGKRQALRDVELFTPEGERVLTAQVELPSIRELLSLAAAGSDPNSEEELTLSTVRIVVEGDLVANADGTINLERALAERPGVKPGPPSDVEVGVGDEDQGRRLAGRLGFDVVLEVPRLGWRDERPGASTTALELSEFTARASADAGGEWRFEANGEVLVGAERRHEGKLRAEFVAPEPDWTDETWPLGLVRGQAKLERVATALIEGVLAGMGTTLPPGVRLEELLGPTIDFEAKVVDATREGGRIEVTSTSAKQELQFEATLEDGRLHVPADSGLRWSLDPPKGLVEARVAQALGEGRSVSLLGARRWGFELRGFEVALDAGESGSIAPRLLPLAEEFQIDVGLGEGMRLATPTGTVDLRGAGADLTLVVRGRTDAAPVARLKANLIADSGAPAPLELDVELGDELDRVLGFELQTTSPGTARFTLRELRVPALLRIWAPEVDPALMPAVGEKGDLAVRVDSLLAEPRTVHASWTSKVLRTELDARIGGDRLAAGVDGKPGGRVEFLGPWIEEHASTYFTKGQRLVRGAASAPPTLLVKTLDLPKATAPAPAVEQAPEADPDGRRALPFDAAGASLTAEFRHPALTLEVPSAGQTVPLTDLVVDVTLPRAGAPRLDFTASDPQGAELSARLLGRERWSLLATGELAPTAATVDVEARAKRLGTALIDGFAASDGLLVDVLGPKLDAELVGTGVSKDSGELSAKLSSNLGTVDWKGRMADGKLVSQGEDKLDARVALTPLFSRRIVGNLVPLLIDVSRDDATKPVLLGVSDCSLPLDGDLSKLSATVNLDLGAVDYSLLPGLENWLGDKLGKRSTTIDPLVLRITDGVVRYDGLPLKVEGHPYRFDGGFDLSSRKMNLATEVPLRNLGERASKELDRARKELNLDPNLAVPIEIGGTPLRPKFDLRSGFLGSLVEDAAGGLLRKGLEKLFGDKKK